MVRSMIAGVAGLKAHQSKMDVIGNNIANVNTWGFKGYSYNFKDSMYTNSVNSSGGSVLAGAAGGRNASQVGYGSQLSSISNVFETGAPSPSANPMDCMIDGTGFFLVGKMVNGSFTNVKDSGLNLSRVGIFRVDENGYLVDDQRSYVYGYAVQEGTGIPEIPARAGSVSLKNIPVELNISPDPKVKSTIRIGNYPAVEVSAKIKSENDMEAAIQEWVAYVTKTDNQTGDFENLKNAVIAFDGIGLDNSDPANPKWTAQLSVTSKVVGQDTKKTNVDPVVTTLKGEPVAGTEIEGNRMEPGIPAMYETELSTIKIPNDPETGLPYELDNYSISEDGTVTGVDSQNRVIPIGKVCIVSVQNPNGLEKTDGYYYKIGDNAGEVNHEAPNTSPAGYIKGSYLEMANVDLANEFSNIITTQRGFQANSKIITVTDEMLQELVSMKR
ncbi:flagellar hook-basal body complex protein [Schaedlerella arabinosiphila]|uniref:flagellar hook-basal body complex protein n=1 Tax=Schaedlerella arabinosiphila TaxID=2044587 RepID=UPI002557CBC8|nr:flagellar hook-basal body complex protein [Schaedlerella arabinosiphila]